MRWPVAWFRAWEEGENENLVPTQVFLVRELASPGRGAGAFGEEELLGIPEGLLTHALLLVLITFFVLPKAAHTHCTKEAGSSSCLCPQP